MSGPSEPKSLARMSVLKARKTDLLDQLAAAEAEMLSRKEADWDDQAIEHEDDEVLEARAEAARLDLRQIDAALHRMKEGDYGRCVRCGTAISDARLDVLPATPFCAACAKDAAAR